MRWALAPQAIVSRGASDAMSATTMQAMLAIAPIVKTERLLEELGVDSERPRFTQAGMQVDRSSIAAFEFGLRKCRNIANPLSEF